MPTNEPAPSAWALERAERLPRYWMTLETEGLRFKALEATPAPDGEWVKFCDVARALDAARAEERESNPLNVERFDDWNRTYRVPEMTPCPEGEWVRWGDVWRFLAELASLRRSK